MSILDLASALSPVPWENVYHVGIVVDDMERAMDDIGGDLKLEWAPRRTANVTVGAPGKTAEPVGLEVVYSRTGPPFLELIEVTKQETVWSGTPGSRIHHLGVYVDDLKSEFERLTAKGMVDEAHGVGPDGELSLFSYLRSPHGVRLELVDGAGRPGLVDWLKG